MKTTAGRQGLGLGRLFLTLSSFTPLFLLLAVRGVSFISAKCLWAFCGLMILVPNAYVLWCRYRPKKPPPILLAIGRYEDHRNRVLVYLFATLLPLYQTALGGWRDLASLAVAFVLVVFLFWRLDLHYLNLWFVARGYRVYTVFPPSETSAHSTEEPFVLITRKPYLPQEGCVNGSRLSRTVYIEEKSP